MKTCIADNADDLEVFRICAEPAQYDVFAERIFAPSEEHCRQYPGQQSREKSDSNAKDQHRCIDVSCLGPRQIEANR